MRERRAVGVVIGPTIDPYAGLAAVHVSPCYDLIVSLRALHNPRVYEATRGWAAEVKARLDPGWFERGRFFFQGFDTALGYGALRLAPDLADGAPPDALIGAVQEADPHVFALRMLDTGETTAEALGTFRRVLDGSASPRELDGALRGVAPEWARRCRRELADPEAARAELAQRLEQYHECLFAAEAPELAEPLEQGRTAAENLLAALPTVEAIERLAGGYTLGDDLPLRRITLAPSIFIHPFMSTRVDERTGEALIVYGVRTDVFLKYERVPVDPELTRALKALADPGRIKVLRLLGKRPMYGTELVKALGLAQPTVHHHFAQLRAAGLVRQERTKGGMRYTIRQDTARSTIDALTRLFAGSD